VIVAAERADDAERLRDAVVALACLESPSSRLASRISATVADFVDPRQVDDPATLVVVLCATTASAADPVVAAAAKWCRENLVPLLPVHDPRTPVPVQMPPEMAELNSHALRIGGSVEALADTAVRLLGLAESDRRAFISYRRSDASPIALQLRAALIDSGWDTFLDRFNVPPATNFQQRLDRELVDKSFVLLLESPDLLASEWVQHEVSYSLSNGLGLMSLRLPTTTAAQLHPAVDPSIRTDLKRGEVSIRGTSLRLTRSALAQVLLKVEREHAITFRMRREKVVADATDLLLAAGYTVGAFDDTTLVAKRSGRTDVLRVVTRAPQPNDLLSLHLVRQKLLRSAPRVRGWLVHPLADANPERAALMKWLCLRRSLSTTPMMLLPGRVAA
jgi:hypothetical protein